MQMLGPDSIYSWPELAEPGYLSDVWTTMVVFGGVFVFGTRQQLLKRQRLRVSDSDSDSDPAGSLWLYTTAHHTHTQITDAQCIIHIIRLSSAMHARTNVCLNVFYATTSVNVYGSFHGCACHLHQLQ
jgi:hypothetical protein